MARETVESIAQRVADGSMDASEAGRKIKVLVTRVPEARTDKDYYEGHHEAAIETDPNSFIHVTALFYGGKISKAQMDAINRAMEGDTKLSGGPEYYLDHGGHPVRKFGEAEVETFSVEGKWYASAATETLTPCSEEEALAAAKKVMGA
jgi:hypothetical protein